MAFDKKEIIPLVLIALIFIIAFYVYPMMPDRMAIHWDEQGVADGYGPKAVGILLMPFVILGLYALLSIIPKIAVFKENIKGFYRYFFAMKVMFVLFFFTLYLATLIPNLGQTWNMKYFVVPWIGIIFIVNGYLLGFAKRNFFIGIRTPWTLANDTVWKKTHDLGRKTFILNGIVMILSLAVLDYVFYIIIISIFANIIFLFLYSFLEYRKIEKKGGEKKARKL